MKILVFLFFLTPLISLSQTLQDLEQAPDTTKRIKQLKIKTLSDLQKITPYESVSVLQKRYLPKTFRGEFGLSAFSIVNHTFFALGGLSVKAGFFIREDHGFGVEAFGLLPPLYKTVTDEMISRPEDKGFFPYGNVFFQLYGGAYYKWSPIFGKFALLNKKIVYFDMYFSLGAGASRIINAYEQIEKKLVAKGKKIPEGQTPSKLVRDISPTGTVSVGQVFALSKNWAIHWDLKCLVTFFELMNNRGDVNWAYQTDIGLSLGMNYYFPGASYR